MGPTPISRRRALWMRLPAALLCVLLMGAGLPICCLIQTDHHGHHSHQASAANSHSHAGHHASALRPGEGATPHRSTTHDVGQAAELEVPCAWGGSTPELAGRRPLAGGVSMFRPEPMALPLFVFEAVEHLEPVGWPLPPSPSPEQEVPPPRTA